MSKNKKISSTAIEAIFDDIIIDKLLRKRENKSTSRVRAPAYWQERELALAAMVQVRKFERDFVKKELKYYKEQNSKNLSNSIKHLSQVIKLKKKIKQLKKKKNEKL